VDLVDDFWKINNHEKNASNTNYTTENCEKILQIEKETTLSVHSTTYQSNFDECEDLTSYFFISTLLFLLQKALRETVY